MPPRAATTGSVAVHGTLAAIFELGAGFHPEFSGRHNARMHAALFGIGGSEAERRIEAAIAFSELGGFIDQPVRTYRRWKAGDLGRIDRDGKARLSNLIGIHKGLRIVFREAQRGYAWIKAPNSAFGGRTALAVMLGGELTDLMRVRRYLDAERGGW